VLAVVIDGGQLGWFDEPGVSPNRVCVVQRVELAEGVKCWSAVKDLTAMLLFELSKEVVLLRSSARSHVHPVERLRELWIWSLEFSRVPPVHELGELELQKEWLSRPVEVRALPVRGLERLHRVAAFFIAPAMKPRTVCFCQPMVFIISDSVAPFKRSPASGTRRATSTGRGEPRRRSGPEQNGNLYGTTMGGGKNRRFFGPA
jgi:hypothetical protein